MKNFTVLVSFLLFWGIEYGVCQDTTQQKDSGQNALKKGNYAIIFEAGTVLGHTNFFEEYNLTAKRHLSDKLALRLSIGGNTGYTTGNGNYSNYETEHRETEEYKFVTTINFQYFLNINSKIKPFISVGPYGEILYRMDNYNDMSSSKEVDWCAGVFASFGVEMFILDNISLIGEYIFKATAGKDYYKEIVQCNTNYLYSTEYKTSFKSARLGFTVYF